MSDLYAPRPDAVDGELFIETTTTARATAALWQILELARREPRPWVPTVVLAGEPGSGRTTVATRFVNAAQRNAACALLAERAPGAEGDAEALARAHRRADEFVRQFGRCPGICNPAAWVPRRLIEQALREAQQVFPAMRFPMSPRPDRDGLQLGNRVWRSEGNRTHHPVRRTSLLMLDDADRLLSVPATRRREVLDRFQAWEEVIKHPLCLVLIGSPALAEAVSETRVTQVIRLDAMANDAEFATVAGMVCGTRDPTEVAALHKASAGLIGRLVHIARMRGLEPPYHVRPEEIVRLPSLPAPE